MWFWLVTMLMPDETDHLVCSRFMFAREQDAIRHFDDEEENVHLYAEEKEAYIVEIEVVWLRNSEFWRTHRWN